MVHININSLLSKTEIERYDLLRLDPSRRGGGVACYIKKNLAYNYKHNFCKNTESIFIDIFLPKSKPILVGILYGLPEKNDFVKNLEETFTGCSILEKQDCYLLGDLNINLLHNGKIFLEKGAQIKTNVITFFSKRIFGFWIFFFFAAIDISSNKNH